MTRPFLKKYIPLSMKIVLFCFACYTGRASAAEVTLNPDRWPSMGIQGGGLLDVKNSQIYSTAGVPDIHQGGAGHDLNFLLDVLVPVSSAWSVQAACGLTYQRITFDQVPFFAPGTFLPSTSNDELDLNASIGARHYFVNRSLPATIPEQNPDHWPSLGLSVIDSEYLQNSQTTSAPGISTDLTTNRVLGFVGDLRLPLSDQITLLGSIEGDFKDTVQHVDYLGTLIGSDEDRYQTLTFSLGSKYYFVGHNLIVMDSGENPDRWISLTLLADWITRVGGHQTDVDFIQSPPTTSDQSIDANGYGLTSRVSVPVTNHLSIWLGVGGSYTQLTVSSAVLSLKTPTSYIDGFVGLRYYFFKT